MTEIVYKGSGFTCPPSVICNLNKYVSLDILRKEAGVLNLRLQRSFKTKIDAICYKFIGILKYIVFVRKLTK